MWFGFEFSGGGVPFSLFGLVYVRLVCFILFLFCFLWSFVSLFAGDSSFSVVSFPFFLTLLFPGFYFESNRFNVPLDSPLKVSDSSQRQSFHSFLSLIYARKEKKKITFNHISLNTQSFPPSIRPINSFLQPFPHKLSTHPSILHLSFITTRKILHQT